MLNNKAYSLVELSISLTIVALLITSGTTIFAKKSEIDRIKITKEKMQIIEKALADYVDINGFLPCPAKGPSIETDSYFGDSQTNPSYDTSTHKCSSNTTNEVGMIPVRNLGLEDKYAYDGWGRKFSYQIATGLGNVFDFADPHYIGDINIVDHNGINITNKNGAAYMILSFGQDGVGAWGKNSTASPSVPASTNIEYNNSLYLSGPSNIYIKDSPAANFNHLVSFKTKPMLTTPKLGISPIKIPQSMCDDASAIARAGFLGFDSNLTGTVSSGSIGSPSNSSLPLQIYKSALSMQKLCNNPPIATIGANNNSASSCSFNPKSISGLALWLDANDPNATGVPPDIGNYINIWYDKSGNGINLTALSASASIDDNLGFSSNKASLYFPAGGNINYQASIYNQSSSMMEFTLFVMQNSSSGTDGIMSYNGAATNCAFNLGTDNLLIDSVNFGLMPYVAENNYLGSSLIAGYASSTNVMVEKLNRLNMRYRNTYQATGSSTCSIGSSYPSKIGFNPKTSLYFSGWIGEILFFNRALLPWEYSAVEGYLVRKWYSGECP